MRQTQKRLDLPYHCLKQDEPTTWNSTYCMLQSIQKQKIVLAAYACEYDTYQLMTPIRILSQYLSS